MAASGLLAPRWARAAIGAGVAVGTVAVGRVLVMPLLEAAGRPGGSGDTFLVLLVVALPLFVAAALSVVADLDRPRPRFRLAIVTGLFFLAGAAAAIGLSNLTGALAPNLGLPLAPAAPAAYRALRCTPPAGLRRLEHVLYWMFAGAFWPVVIALFAGFLLHISVAPDLVYVAGAAAFGAAFTLILCDLDPDRPPPAETRAG